MSTPGSAADLDAGSSVLGVDDLQVVLFQHAGQRENIPQIVVHHQHLASGQHVVALRTSPARSACALVKLVLGAMQQQHRFLQQPFERRRVARLCSTRARRRISPICGSEQRSARRRSPAGRTARCALAPPEIRMRCRRIRYSRVDRNAVQILVDKSSALPLRCAASMHLHIFAADSGLISLRMVRASPSPAAASRAAAIESPITARTPQRTRPG